MGDGQPVPPKLDYSTARPRLKWKLGAVITVLVLGFIHMQVEHIRQDLGWIDSISGSHQTQSTWRFGWSSPARVTDSPLAIRYREMGLQWQPNWCNVKGTYVNIFGRKIGSGHGRAPAIYFLAVHPDLQQAYINQSSDDEVRELFHILSSGTEAEQDAACEAATNRALNGSRAASSNE
jgi:hypothetical protein